MGSTSPMIFSTWLKFELGLGLGLDDIRARVWVRVRVSLDLLSALPGRGGAGGGTVGDARSAEQLSDTFPLGGHRAVVRSIALVSEKVGRYAVCQV